MKKILLFLTFSPILMTAQTAGDVVFATDQVVEVRITFNQVGYWDSLVANYSTETDMIAASMEFIDNTGSHVVDSINIRLKGNSSYGHPGNKKSFKVDFNDFVSGQTYDGMKKLNFNNGFKDPTFMREKIFMDLCRTAGIPAPRISFCNVYMNDVFWGFYTMVEQVDKEFIQNNFADDTGNLFKAGDGFGSNPVFADLKDYGSLQSSYETRYELKTNEVVNDWTDLIEFIGFINTSTSTDFGNNLGININKTPYLRSVATDVLFANLDSYQNSARNYYIYHDMLNDRWEWIKWDGNESFGSYTGGPGTGTMTSLAPNYIAANRPLIQNTFNNSALYNEYLIELCWIMNQYFNNTYLDPKIDAVKALIQPHVYADNLKQYSNAQFDQNTETNISVSGGMGSQTIYGLKSFITARYNYLQGVVDCSLGTFDADQLQVVVYPNPFTNAFTIKGVNEFAEIKMLDMNGRSVDFEKTVNSNEVVISTNAVEGIYFVVITTDELKEMIKIIKE
jgi:spore coat protein CotH